MRYESYRYVDLETVYYSLPPSYRKELPADRVKKLVGVVWIKIGSEDEMQMEIRGN
ncbi:MAG TPA: hypothetical protein HA348_04830 [Thermoplasmata archaeon]|nr:hypothetical protein [Thermoplasmata archaeon]